MTPFDAIAAYDFHGTPLNHQLSIRENDLLQVIDQTATGWLWGTNLRTGQSGWFPKSVARLVVMHDNPAQEKQRIDEPSLLMQQQITDDGFSGQAMGGQQITWSPPAPSGNDPSASKPETSKVTFVPVPDGPKSQNPLQQTSWVVSKAARRTGRLVAKASNTVGNSIFKHQPIITTDKPPEIIKPSIRWSNCAEQPKRSARR